MAKILQCTHEIVALAANTTNYAIVGSGLLQITSAVTTESQVQVIQRTTGTFSSLLVGVSANGITATTNYNFRKGTANGNQTVAVANSTTGEFTDATHTDTVASGDLCDVQQVIGATGTTISAYTISSLFDASSGMTIRYVLNRNPATNGALGNQFLVLTGFFAFDNNNLEADVQLNNNVAGTLSNYCWKVTSNAKAAASTATIRKGAANTTITLSVAGGTTGNIEDTTHTATTAVNDLINQALNYGADAGLLGTGLTAIDYSFTGNSAQYIAQFANHSFNHNDSEFSTVQGEYGVNTPENQWQQQSLVAGNVTQLFIQLLANAVTATSTRTFRVNSANKTNTLSIGASASGLFIDSTHTDAVVASDDIDIGYVNGVTGADTGIVIAQGLTFTPSSTQAVMPSMGFLGVGGMA